MVPEGWTISTLPDVIGINGIITDGDWIESKDQDPNGDVRLIQLADIGDGRFINKSSRYLTSQKAKDLKCTYLHPGDILIARMPEPLGRACIFPGVEKPSISVVDVCIIHTGKNVDRVWLTATINSQHFRGEIVSRSSGTTRTRISRKNLAQIKILLPQFEEQQKIADILSSVDDAIQATQAVIDQTRRVKQGLMQQLLTRGIGHTRFKQTEIGAIPEEWDVKPLETLSKSINNGFVGTAAKHYVNDGIPYLMAKNIRDNRIELGQLSYISDGFHKDNPRSFLETGDLLTVQSGHIGTSATVPLELSGANCHALIITKLNNEQINSDFIAYYFNSPSGRNRLSRIFVGTTIKHINTKDLRKFLVPLPSRAEQTKIANIFKEIDKNQDESKSFLIQLNQTKKGLMQDLLTGCVRVKPDEVNTT